MKTVFEINHHKVYVMHRAICERQFFFYKLDN
jgi:hypothetical protein